MKNANMQKIYEFFKKDRFAEMSGVELLHVEPGKAEARMQITERHLNSYGAVMGGAIFTLADYAFAAAMNAKVDLCVSSSANIVFFRPPKGGYLVAKAEEVSSGRKLCTCNVDVFDADGTLVARYTGNGYFKNESIG